MSQHYSTVDSVLSPIGPGRGRRDGWLQRLNSWKAEGSRCSLAPEGWRNVFPALCPEPRALLSRAGRELWQRSPAASPGLRLRAAQTAPSSAAASLTLCSSASAATPTRLFGTKETQLGPSAGLQFSSENLRK